MVVALGEYLFAVVQHLQRTEIGLEIGQFLHFTLPVDAVYVHTSVPYTDEIDECILRVRPAELIDIRVETLSKIALFTCLEVVHAEALAVSFIAVACH